MTPPLSTPPPPYGVGFPLFPASASIMSARVDNLFFFMLALTGSVTVLIALLIIWFAFRYRRRSPGEIPPQITGSTRLEIAWTVIPFILFMIPFVWGARLYLDFYRPVANAEEIDVVAKQWMWKFEHVGGQREIDELHVPVGRPVRLTMTSQDVVHSFFVPDFRTKQDVIPGRYTSVVFQATRPGRFHLFCSEYCGTDHSHMRGYIVAMEPSDYERWLALGASESMASKGQKLFLQLGCNTCHRGDTLRRAPVLQGLFGQPVQLSTGETIIADEGYIRESILDPTAKIVFGWQPIMPTFRGRVSEEQILELIAYIRSIGPGQAAPPSAAEIPPEGQPLFPTQTR